MAAEPSSPGERLAARMEAVLAEVKETAYQHRTEIDEEAGAYRCDCSGLIGYFLRQNFPEAYLALKGEEAPWRKRPVSVTFYETFIRAAEIEDPHWMRVRRMMDVRPGDVLAWRNDEIIEGETSGHTCVVAGLPAQEADGRIKVRVIDSTRKRHAEDTRPEGTSGVGAGFMWFVVNDAGEPVRFYVDGGDRPAEATKVAIGRLKDKRAGKEES